MDFEKKKKSGYMCATLWHFFHFLFYLSLSLCLLTTYKSLLCFSIISYCTLGLFLVRIRFTSANSLNHHQTGCLIKSVLEKSIHILSTTYQLPIQRREYNFFMPTLVSINLLVYYYYSIDNVYKKQVIMGTFLY